jgi:hypothetical protein
MAVLTRDFTGAALRSERSTFARRNLARGRVGVQLEHAHVEELRRVIRGFARAGSPPTQSVRPTQHGTR